MAFLGHLATTVTVLQWLVTVEGTRKDKTNIHARGGIQIRNRTIRGNYDSPALATSPIQAR